MQRRAFTAGLTLAGLAPVPRGLLAATPGNATTAFVEGVLRQQLMPQLHSFARAAMALAATCERWSSRGPTQRAAARLAWEDALVAWARLSTLLVGPLAERHPARRVDTSPVQPALLLQAIERTPRGAEELAQVGDAAKGLGALEWLLWDSRAPVDDDARRYAVVLARDIAVEAEALVHDFALMLARPRTAEDTRDLLSQILNHWVGSVEQLRVLGLERPAQGADAQGRATGMARSLSGAAALERQARWQALGSVLVSPGDPPPPWSPGVSAPTLDQLLQAEGHEALSAHLRAAVPRTDVAVRAAGNNQRATMQEAARLLGELKGLVETEAAPALDVRIRGYAVASGRD